jgi:hypothetical protein
VIIWFLQVAVAVDLLSLLLKIKALVAVAVQVD